MNVTVEYLNHFKACPDQVNLFMETFGESVELSIDNTTIAYDAGLDLVWVCYRLFTKDAQNDYEAKRKPIRDDYEAKRKPIDADYQAKRKLIYEDYLAKIKTLLIEMTADLKNYKTLDKLTEDVVY